MSSLSTLLALFGVVWLSTFAAAQSSSTDSLFADTACNSNLCLRVVYSDSERRMNMTMSANGGGGPIGWYAVGTGKQMDGSNMMIGWVDTSGNPVMSQRTAGGHEDPTTSISALAATLEPKFSFSNSTGTVWTWSFPMSSSDQTPSSSTAFIWASNKNNNPASSPSSPIRRHTAFGSLTLDLTKPFTPSTTTSGSNSTGNNQPVTPGNAGGALTGSSRVMDHRNRMIVAHMVMMVVAWFIVIPAGILVGRYGRTFFKWFPVHRGIQLGGFTLVLIGFIIILIETSQNGGRHFQSTHAKAGLGIVIIMLLQVGLGVVGHRTKRFHASRVVHVVVGLGVVGLGVWNSTEGFELWSWGVGRWVSWMLWIWAGLVAVAYLAGLALLPRDLRQWRETSGVAEEKQEYLGLQPKTSPGASTQQHSPGDYTQPHPGWGAPPLQTHPSRAYQSYAQPSQPDTTNNRI